jgi:carbamoyltransferase
VLSLTSLLRPRLGVLVHHPPRSLTLPSTYCCRHPAAVASPPTISIVTPSFNAAEFIGRTIDSVLSQEYPALEYIVQDGASTDHTMTIVERHRHRLHRVTAEPDRGQADALNRGFAHASGDVLAYLNADDLLLPGALAYVADVFSAHPEIDVVYGHRVLIDEQDREIGRWVLPPHDDRVLSWADYVPQETLFWRRRTWEAVGASFDDSFHFAMDWDLLVRMRDSGARFYRAPRFLGAFRVHAQQKTSERIDTVGASEMARIRERIHGQVVDWQQINNALRGYLRRHVVCDGLYRAGVLKY